jgi:hypothetical protein
VTTQALGMVSPPTRQPLAARLRDISRNVNLVLTPATGASARSQKLAPACGLGAHAYDLRHSFASLRIQEGRPTIVEVAEQLGQRVIAEFKGGGQVDPERADRGGPRGRSRPGTGRPKGPNNEKGRRRRRP